MLHLKEKIKLENGYIREYKESDFIETFNMVWELQQKIQVFHFNSMKISSPILKFQEFKMKFEKLIANNKYKFLLMDKDRETIAGFVAFYFEKSINRNVLEFACKRLNYIFDQKAKEIFLDSMRQHDDKKFRVFLGKRDNYANYVKFIMRTFKHEYIGEDELGRVVLDFDLTKDK